MNRERRLKAAAIIFTAIMLGLSLIRPPYPNEQLLQHGPTVAALAILAFGVEKNWLPTASLLCMLAFLGLHILGARYIYTYVPYDDWSAALAGTSISEALGWDRNHYDRLVHFWFGVLCVPPAFQLATRFGNVGVLWGIAFALSVVLAISAVYEIFEWLLTVVMSPQNAEAYNGQQGDPWDAQKDMALAFAGAIIAIPALRLVRIRAAP